MNRLNEMASMKILTNNSPGCDHHGRIDGGIPDCIYVPQIPNTVYVPQEEDDLCTVASSESCCVPQHHLSTRVVYPQEQQQQHRRRSSDPPAKLRVLLSDVDPIIRGSFSSSRWESTGVRRSCSGNTTAPPSLPKRSPTQKPFSSYTADHTNNVVSLADLARQVHQKHTQHGHNDHPCPKRRIVEHQHCHVCCTKYSSSSMHHHRHDCSPPSSNISALCK